MKQAVYAATLFLIFFTSFVSANQSTSDPSETDFLAIKSSVDTVNRGGTGNSAKGLIKRFIKKYPNSPYLDDVYLLRSVFAFHRNDPKDAKKWLTKIEKDFPQSEHTKNAQAHLTAIDNLTVSLKKSDASWYDKKKAYKNVGRSLSDHYTATITPAQTPKEPIRVATHNPSASKPPAEKKNIETTDKFTSESISNPAKKSELKKGLSDAQKMITTYNLEARKLFNSEKFSLSQQPKKTPRQTKIRQLLDVQPFPLGHEASIEEITTKHREIIALMNEAINESKKIREKLPKDRFSVKAPIELQRKLAREILYPRVVEIQGKIIQLYAIVPRTREGFEKALYLNQWFSLNEYQYASDNWSHIFRNSHVARWNPSSDCENFDSTQNDKVGGDKDTGICYQDIPFNTALIRDIWRISYMREMDKELAEKAKKEGVDLNLDIFKFAFGLNAREFMNGLQKFDSDNMPPSNNRFCLYDNCDSDVTRLYLSIVNNEEASLEIASNQHNILDEKHSVLATRWNASKSLTKTELHQLQTDTVEFARDKAPIILRKSTSIAVSELQQINTGDASKFEQWNKNTGEPLRLRLAKWQQLFEAAFFVTDNDRMVNAFRYDRDKYRTSSINALDNSPYMDIFTTLFEAHYDWIKTSEKGTVADLSITDYASKGWQVSQSTLVNYTKPTRFYGRLMTPMELTFSGLADQFGQGIGSGMQIAATIKELDIEVDKARQSFYKCLPNCNNRELFNRNLAAMLAKKDLYFLENAFGGSNNHLDQSKITLGFGALAGSITGEGADYLMVDNGIPQLCKSYFDEWAIRYYKESGTGSIENIMGAFQALATITSGSFGELKKFGQELLENQRKAYSLAEKEYGKYQVCRDQWEFDRAPK